MTDCGLKRRLSLIAILLGVAVLVTPAGAQDKPRYGGELIFAVPSEMPSYDGHREGTFGMVHPLAPHYNTLLRVDPNDRTGTKIVSDLAESWTISPDGRLYPRSLRPHGGSLGRLDTPPGDVMAPCERLVFPPAGRRS